MVNIAQADVLKSQSDFYKSQKEGQDIKNQSDRIDLGNKKVMQDDGILLSVSKACASAAEMEAMLSRARSELEKGIITDNQGKYRRTASALADYEETQTFRYKTGLAGDIYGALDKTKEYIPLYNLFWQLL